MINIKENLHKKFNQLKYCFNKCNLYNILINIIKIRPKSNKDAASLM